MTMMQERPSLDHVQRSFRVAKAAMKSSKLWAKKPEAYNQLLYALIVSAENIAHGRPSIEDPDNSAAWCSAGEGIGGLGFAFEILQEVAESNGDPFFEHPEGAGVELLRIFLHFRALDLAMLSGKLEYGKDTKPAGREIKRPFALLPVWPPQAVGPLPDDLQKLDGDQPLVLTDGYCGHNNMGISCRYSECSICGPHWQKEWSASLDRRRAWERRRDERLANASAIQREAERLLQARRRELYGVKECDLPHETPLEPGAIRVSPDGSRAWKYMGQEGDSPRMPWNWAAILSHNPNSAPQHEVDTWNHGLTCCPNCNWTPENDAQRAAREAKDRRKAYEERQTVAVSAGGKSSFGG